MRSLPLGHLLTRFPLHGCGVGDSLLSQHSVQVGDLDLGFGGLQQALPDEILLLLLSGLPPLSPQLLQLLLGQLQGLGRRGEGLGSIATGCST